MSYVGAIQLGVITAMSPQSFANRPLMLRLSALASVAGFVGAALPPTEVMAAEQETLQEVVVTAQKREENARNVPITMTVFDGASIQAEGFTGLDD